MVATAPPCQSHVGRTTGGRDRYRLSCRGGANCAPAAGVCQYRYTDFLDKDTTPRGSRRARRMRTELRTVSRLVLHEQAGGALDVVRRRQEEVLERRGVGHRRVERADDAHGGVEPLERLLLDHRGDALAD